MTSHSDNRRVAIVTGAGRGLGRSHALALAQAGWRVVVNDLGGAGDGSGADSSPAAQVVAEIAAMGGEAIANFANVADWQAAEGLIATAIDHFGRLDGLVNNAGILRDRMLANVSEDDWDLAVAVNLKGTAAPLHHAARHWRDLSKQRGEPCEAAVVNTSSSSGLYSAVGQANYAAAKAGVASLSLVAARELARYGVRVNCIAPAATTRLTAPLMPEEMKASLDPSLVSPLIVYLLDPRASGVTGRTFEIGGGAVALVDTPRPGAGFRSGDTPWTVERLAEAIPAVLGAGQQPYDPREAMTHMAQLPIHAG